MMIELSSQETAHAVAEWTKQKFGVSGNASAYPSDFGCYQVRFDYDEASKKPQAPIKQDCTGLFVEDRCNVEHARDHLEGLFEQLYMRNCDAEFVERHLEELAWALGYKLPNTPIKI